ncbi:recombinase family protein [Paenibacillus lutimineralis]|uniref:Recombinase family protein n=1 Tax=Paenibacillus lutimineralis TaxID=2707005 RepID=A0A3S9V1H9_9BACL|nr:recombinase family protein [Paenibacillus lutimineralis]AZS16454.1 recombinase family protein [Paenibacillus lutimineralis]
MTFLHNVGLARIFYEEKGWVFVKEYVEQVSGFRTYARDRDKIQEAMNDADNGKFDVLLCWMFDRLGRKEAETPFVVEWFAKRVQVWSVVEGQQKFEQHTDHLTNYIRFWQAEGESKKTSVRVTENQIQMTEDGLFTGGSAGYGYKLVKSGVFNKKGKELLMRVKDEETNHTAYQIYDLVYSFGLGSQRIAKYYNSPEINIPSPTGGKWTTGAINFILKNPLYKGCPTIKKRRDDEGKLKTIPVEEHVKPKKAVPHLITVPEHTFIEKPREHE